MNMRKLLLLLTTVFMMGGSKAQSIAEAREQLYYERYDGAAHLLQNLLHADPNNSEAWLLLTQTYVHRRRISALHDTLSNMPVEASRQPLGLCALGQLALEEHRKDSAAHYFDEALAITKQKDPVILLAIARAHQSADSGDAQYAVTLLDMAIKRDKHDPGLYVALGDAYRRLADGGSSFKAYEDALAQDKRYAAALYRIGKIFISQNNPDMYVKYFNDAVSMDSLYAPAWYELYYYNYFRDVNKAMICLNHYVAATDPSVANDYLITDLLYASRKYQAAIDHAQELIARQGGTSEPRMYKLIAYSYKELGDSLKALDFMKQYFHEQTDTGFVVKDYETMGEIYRLMGRTDSAVAYLAKAGGMEKDSVQRIAYAKKLAELYKEQKDYTDQALWLGRYYSGNSSATNLDLFNWGLAYYMAREYPLADSIFGVYETKYPDQDFGYYWRARSDVAIDTAMSTGMAIPQYTKLIEIDGKDTLKNTNRRHLIEAYGYIAAYKANTEKDYPGSIDYFQRLLTLDPDNRDARRYIDILKKNLSKASKGSRRNEAERPTESPKTGTTMTQ
jgi:predicted Zn-dependent protease